MTAYTYFKNAAHNKRISATDIAALCLIKAANSKSEDKVGVAQALLKRSFSPVTHPNKLAHGAVPYGALNQAIAMVKYQTQYKAAPFQMTEEQAKLVNDLANAVGKF